MRLEQRGWAKRLSSTSNWHQEETLAATKPFDIPVRMPFGCLVGAV